MGGDTRYKKIIAKPREIEALLIEEGVKAIPRKSREIILDFDATDDPLHGNQEGAFFHGYYRNYCYLPLYCFCGNIPLLAQLRDAKRDASSGTRSKPQTNKGSKSHIARTNFRANRFGVDYGERLR